MSPSPLMSAQRKGKHPKKMVRAGEHSDVDGRRTSVPTSETNTGSRIRVVGSRIYDSVNGKSCHQCRQKTRDFVASCKNLKNDKTCSISYCYKCLSNRYGEKAEEMALLEGWKCPKCRNICNCSFCRKKKGCTPTGILVFTAKATGFSSVSEMLQAIDPDNSCKNVKDTVCSPKSVSPSKESPVVSSRKRGKENSFDRKEDSISHPPNLAFSPDETKPKKIKREQLKEHAGNLNDGASLKKSSLRKPHITQEMFKTEVKAVEKDDDVPQEGGSRASVFQKVPLDSTVVGKKGGRHTTCENVGVLDKAIINGTGAKCNKIDRPHNLKKCRSEKQRKEFEVGVVPGSHDSNVKGKGEERDCTTSQIGDVLDDVIIDNAGAKPSDLISNKVKKHSMKFQRKKFDVDASRSCDSAVKEVKEDVGHCKTIQNVGVLDAVETDDLGAKPTEVAKYQQMKDYDTELELKEFDVDVPLPQGISLTTVADVDLSPEDVGHALQFIEFCAAFGRVIGLKKRQSESVLQELAHGYNGPQGRLSLTAQLHIKLLSVILKDSGENYQPLTSEKGKNPWLKALEKCISTSPCAPKELSLNCFEMASDGYDSLDFSTKLRLLNFLCHESLCTERLRSYIDKQNAKFVEKEKEAKEDILAAKDKTKKMKQKLQDERVRVIIGQNEGSVSVSNHEAVFSQIKTQVEEAQAETLKAISMLSKMKKRSDAVRTDPIFSDIVGHSFWRLKAYSDEPEILLQDVGTWIVDTPKEKWFSYDLEQKNAIEDYISLRPSATAATLIFNTCHPLKLIERP